MDGVWWRPVEHRIIFGVMDLQNEQLIERGREAFERRDYVAALADFREVLERRPDYADIRHLSGLCLCFLGQPETALTEFDRALALNPAYVEAHLNRAISLNDLGRYDEAQQAFDQATRHEQAVGGRFLAAVSARLANAHAGIGDLYAAAQAHAEASEQYRRALTLRPRFLDIRNKLAESLLAMGEYETAALELETVLDTNPDFVSARLNLGLVHHRTGDRARAAAEWERARSVAPGHPQVRAYQSMLGRQTVAHDPSGGREAAS